ncbi:hypothetical protein ATKI12_6216 [Kitasatospora sp. Ki12]
MPDTGAAPPWARAASWPRAVLPFCGCFVPGSVIVGVRRR